MKKTDPIIDVDALALLVDRLDGKLPPSDIAYLRALTQRLLDIRKELLSSDASMDGVRRVMRGIKS
jgi:hypothetical protein